MFALTVSCLDHNVRHFEIEGITKFDCLKICGGEFSNIN